ncbi:MAG: Type-2 restriction enzyme MjaIII [Methanomethylovorans sp. PtaU1.Bin073]|nr:MAG: Type-2 restriction enzyme MjaIII [Methanomethylovorans sp. PtaU1.Bin073]
MKYIDFYNNLGVSEKDVFNNFINGLKSSIKVWDYFVNWDKVNANLDQITIELNILNSLIGSTNIERDFISLVMKYPEVIKTLPVLLAVRESNLEIIKDYQKGDLDYLVFDFIPKRSVSDAEAERYFTFISKSGLIDLFCDKKIKNFVDYVFGVEVGLDSNGRKNRGGTLMEEIVEVLVRNSIAKNTYLEMICQATPVKIKSHWGYHINFEKSARSYDFAVFNKLTKKLFVIETNFYNGGGSKLKSVCGEFKILYNELSNQGIEMIWVTDGKGWLTTQRPLEETFNNNNYVLNLYLLKKGILDEIFNQ